MPATIGLYLRAAAIVRFGVFAFYPAAGTRFSSDTSKVCVVSRLDRFDRSNCGNLLHARNFRVLC